MQFCLDRRVRHFVFNLLRYHRNDKVCSLNSTSPNSPLNLPIGTAKTTICEALAERMGFDFCVIDTASFLADGLSNVAARIRYVFRRLMALNSSIILFDEIEEFALDRETPGISMESRMLTTAMLTAINDLRSTKQSIFFIATNRLRAFDSAITRRGRFDMQLFVGTPNLESRVRQFQEKLAGIGVEDDEINKDEAIESYRDFLESEWSKDAMYMNYLEGMVRFPLSCFVYCMIIHTELSTHHVCLAICVCLCQHHCKQSKAEQEGDVFYPSGTGSSHDGSTIF